MKVIEIIAIGLFVWFITAEVNHANLFNRWTHACNRINGQISQTHATFWETRYECFVNGKKVVVKGYEQYK